MVDALFLHRDLDGGGTTPRRAGDDEGLLTAVAGVLLDHAWVLLDHTWVLLDPTWIFLDHTWVLLASCLTTLGSYLTTLGSCMTTLGSSLTTLESCFTPRYVFGTLSTLMQRAFQYLQTVASSTQEEGKTGRILFSVQREFLFGRIPKITNSKNGLM